jgi:hypothetical protein
VPVSVRLAAVALIATIALAGAGCGGGTGSPSDAVARVGTRPITRASLDHWMNAVVGEDYLEHIGRRAPSGLASDPPDYSRCVTVAQRIVPKRPGGADKLDRQTIADRCRQLRAAILRQALEILILIETSAAQAAEQHVRVTLGEVDAMLARVKSERFPTEAAFAKHLADNNMTLADELTLLRQNLINTKLIAKFRQSHTGGDWQIAYGRFLQAELGKWRNRTSCRAGYVVPQCKQYHQSGASSQDSAAVQLENLAAGR